MSGFLNWFIDFDETLASGAITWAFESAFPKLIREYHLPNDPARLQAAALVALERAAHDDAAALILHQLFETMGWPAALERTLFDDILTNYQPRLFDDATPFLERLKRLNRRVFVLSNNPLSLKLIALLEIEGYVSGIYTPTAHPGTRPKPHRSLWDVIVAADPLVTADNSALVGDDPWADGTFATTCGIACWLVDREARFDRLRGDTPYHWVRSLADIPLPER